MALTTLRAVLLVVLVLAVAALARHRHAHAPAVLASVDAARVFPSEATRSFDRYTQPEVTSVPSTTIRVAPVPRPASEHSHAPPAPVAQGPTPGGWLTAGASWYGPGFMGHRTACGQTLTEGLVGVAHKTLPCGTLVTFRVGDRTVTAPVVDRGPYVAGRAFDLTAALCRALAHCWTGPLNYRLGAA